MSTYKYVIAFLYLPLDIMKAIFFGLFMLACAVIAAGQVKLQDCSAKQQLDAAQSMCKTYGKDGSHIACVCQESMPVCVMANLENQEQAIVCDDKTFAACTKSCGSSIMALKCEGTESTKCISLDASARKAMLSGLLSR